MMNYQYQTSRSLYRSRSGMIMGVCKGFANYFSLGVFWVRFIAVALLLFTGFWPVTILYFVAAMLMKPAPIVPLNNDAEQEFYQSYTGSRKMALSRLKRTYENLDRRIRRIEHIVTSRDYDWERRFNASK